MGVLADLGLPPDPGVAELFQAARVRLLSCGFSAQSVEVAGFERALPVMAAIYGPEMAAAHRALLSAPRGDLSPELGPIWSAAWRCPRTGTPRRWRRGGRSARPWRPCSTRWTCSSCPPPLTRRAPSGAPARTPTSGTPAPSTCTGQPAISLPMGQVDGLPVGLQLVARRGDDATAAPGRGGRRARPAGVLMGPPRYANLHLHSRHSRATSGIATCRTCGWPPGRRGSAWSAPGTSPTRAGRRRSPPALEPAAARACLACGPSWPGALRAGARGPAAAERGRAALRAQRRGIATIYKKGERTRKVHHVCWPRTSRRSSACASAWRAIGNLGSDGRPILGLDSRDLLEITLESGPGSLPGPGPHLDPVVLRARLEVGLRLDRGVLRRPAPATSSPWRPGCRRTRP